MLAMHRAQDVWRRRRRSDDEDKTRAQQQQQQEHQEREEEYQRLFPKRNNVQHDDEDKINQPHSAPHPVLRPKSSFPASGKRFLPYKKFSLPTSKFAVSQPTLPEPSSIPERDEASSSVTYPDCRPPVKRVQARGCFFDIAPMPLSSHPPPTDEQDASAQPQGVQQSFSSSASSSPPSPSTTHHHHRQERADSHQEDVTTTTTNAEVSSRDFAATPRDALTVPSLTIRKNLQPPTTRIPSSPRSSPRSPSETMPVPPQTAENERKRDTTEPAYTTTTTTAPVTLKDKLWGAIPSSSSSASASSSFNNNNNKASSSKSLGLAPLRDQTRLIPAPAPAAAAAAGGGSGGGKARQGALPSTITPGGGGGGGRSAESSSGVVVRPPLYDFNKPAGLQWASPGITNSRPAAPWEPCPRWTCCLCGAETIVEQKVCANLDCGHDRCPVKCQIRVQHRDRTMFR